MAQIPKISIVMAADDHPPDFDILFGGLIGQTLAPEDYEVILIDANCLYDYGPAYERALKLKDPKLRLIYEAIDKGGRAKSNNRGLELSRAPIILFFSDDILLAPRTAEVHLKFHEEYRTHNVVGVGSALVPEKFRNRFTAWLEESGELWGIPVSEEMVSVPENFFYIGNTSVKRQFLDLAGSFDEAFPYHAWDDFEFGVRLSKNGMKAVYLPEIGAEHYHDISLQERCQTMEKAGESAVIFELKYPGEHPWHSKTQVSPWRYRAHCVKSLLQYAGTRRDEYIHSYYRARLAQSFAAGYNHAVKQSHSRA